MFRTIAAKVERDADYPERQYRMDILTRVLKGTLYDVLEHPFHAERTPAGEYIPLHQRRPSARYGLCKVVVDDSVSLLFDEGHFPAIDCEDGKIRDVLAAVVKENRLNETMIDAATRGSVGSVAIQMQVFQQKEGGHRVFFKVLETQFLTPTWDPVAPDTLLKVREQYKVRGKVLAGMGYAITDEAADYWFAREWDAAAETWFLPWPVKSKDDASPATPQVDAQRTVAHGLGFVPLVWVKNLPGGDDIDGGCTFPTDAIDCSIQIDYQLSQLGRGLKYSSDPTLLIKEPSALMAAVPVSTGFEGPGGGSPGPAIPKGGDNAIVVGPDGDAKLLEINGTAAAAVLDYVRCLRELALESAHGNRSNADKISAAQSGRAMELMNQSLIWLADKLRIPYGEGALLKLLTMVCKVSERFDLIVQGEKVGKLTLTKPLGLRWPRWYAPTADDRLNDANTIDTLVSAGAMSQETAVKTVADTYDVEDVPAEIARIKADQAEAQKAAEAGGKVPGTHKPAEAS